METAPHAIDTSNGTCGLNMALTPSAWGTLLKAHLSTP